jgi:hypothetical protein
MSDKPANLERPRPPEWQRSLLFNFIEDCWNNSIATVGNKNVFASQLSTIDSIFDDFRQNPNMSAASQIVPALLFMRSFTSYRAAVMLATCLSTDAYPLLRSCLENAGYANLISTETSLSEGWLRRDENEVSKTLVRNKFKQSMVRNAIKASDERLSQIYQDLYERCIDFGAHPNEKAVTTNIVRESLNSKTLQFTLLAGDSISLDHALRTTAQVGICSLKLMGLVFKKSYEGNGYAKRVNDIAQAF